MVRIQLIFSPPGKATFRLDGPIDQCQSIRSHGRRECPSNGVPRHAAETSPGNEDTTALAVAADSRFKGSFFERDFEEIPSGPAASD